MPLLLPSNYPTSPIAGYPTIGSMEYWNDQVQTRPIKVGIFNIMPQAEKYEHLILNRLANTSFMVKPQFLKSDIHVYRSSCHTHLRSFYASLENIADDPPQAIILTGAPVEKLTNEKISYWSEIEQLAKYCLDTSTPLLGICWGGIALGNILGIKSQMFKQKVFGVYNALNLRPHSFMMQGIPPMFYCPQSRYAGLDEADLARFEQNGSINRLASSPGAGTFVFETDNSLIIGHLGHPEYLLERLAFEWKRDQNLGLPIVAKGFTPNNPTDNWSVSSNQLFENWLRFAQNIRNSTQRETF